MKVEEYYEAEIKKNPSDRVPKFKFFQEYITSATGDVFTSKTRESVYPARLYNLETTLCDSCGGTSVWLQDRLIYPIAGPSGSASDDMPEIVKNLYNEASAVFTTSPKASAALLRLSLQHLLIFLGEKGKNINEDINSLIDKGLSEDVAEIMTVLRVVGNESVHPGTLSVDDDPEMAEGLFEILNQIVEELITRPRKRKELMDRLPKNKTADVKAKLEKRKET